ncbi:hypothetical protein A2U01_0054860, partial [Trifolium medium]|nr:hypothetical protein [Trifolium medium]
MKTHQHEAAVFAPGAKKILCLGQNLAVRKLKLLCLRLGRKKAAPGAKKSCAWGENLLSCQFRSFAWAKVGAWGEK